MKTQKQKRLDSLYKYNREIGGEDLTTWLIYILTDKQIKATIEHFNIK
jgi:hypothetical protein